MAVSFWHICCLRWVPTPQLTEHLDQSPTVQCGGQSVLAQDLRDEALGPWHSSSERFKKLPSVKSCRQVTLRFCVPPPQVLEHCCHSSICQLGGQSNWLHACKAWGFSSLHSSGGEGDSPGCRQYTSRVWMPTPQVAEQGPQEPMCHLGGQGSVLQAWLIAGGRWTISHKVSLTVCWVCRCKHTAMAS